MSFVLYSLFTPPLSFPLSRLSYHINKSPNTPSQPAVKGADIHNEFVLNGKVMNMMKSG